MTKSETELVTRNVLLYERLRDELLCPICHEFIIDAVVLSECGHTFCKACLSQWINTKHTCPECRANVRTKPTRCRVFDSLVNQLVPESPTGTSLKRISEWRSRSMNETTPAHAVGTPPKTSPQRPSSYRPETQWSAEYASPGDVCTCCGIRVNNGSLILVKQIVDQSGQYISTDRYMMRCCRKQIAHIAFNQLVSTSLLRPVDVAEFRNMTEV